MPRPRKQLISYSVTPYYHVTSRCVRRAFLCGEDRVTGRSYEHRRSWIEQRIQLLSSLFAVEICAYAVMSNHYHMVVKLVPEEAHNWSIDTVLNRWCSLFKGPLVVQQYRAGAALSGIESETVRSIAAVYRKRLTDLSWFMKCLNEPVARRANKEDRCTGHFWEARFASQALRTDAALLSCMAYVDLNPVRAKMAPTPEASDYTSIQARLGRPTDLQSAIQSMLSAGDLIEFSHNIRPLLAFKNSTTPDSRSIPISFGDYLQLLDETGRVGRHGKKGAIDSKAAPILQRLRVNVVDWLQDATDFETTYSKRQTIGQKAKRAG